MIQAGYITKEELLAQTSRIGASETELIRLWKAMGGRAVRCGAPTRGGYGYDIAAVHALRKLYALRPAHIHINDWRRQLTSRNDAMALRKMAGLRWATARLST